MSIFDAMNASSSALQAQRMRLDITAENLANAESVGYRRKDVVLRQTGASFGDAMAKARGVEVSQITTDQAEQRRVLDPTHPDADAQGYVELPNVDTVT